MTKFIKENNANSINLELLKLSVLDTTEGGCFAVITHPINGDTAFIFRDITDKDGNIIGNQIDSDILVRSGCDITGLRSLVATYTESEKDLVEAKINEFILTEVGEEPKSGFVLGRFPFSAMVVGYATIIEDEQIMIDEGWVWT